jgi:hypothetical protein
MSERGQLKEEVTRLCVMRIQEVLRSLVKSMPRRLQEVIDIRRGGNTTLYCLETQ